MVEIIILFAIGIAANYCYNHSRWYRILVDGKDLRATKEEDNNDNIKR